MSASNLGDGPLNLKTYPLNPPAPKKIMRFEKREESGVISAPAFEIDNRRRETEKGGWIFHGKKIVKNRK